MSQTATHDMYRYQPLPPVPDRGKVPPFIRVLFLAPGDEADAFHGTLEVVNVEEVPPYESLSYT
jgi:hypothetical protein